MRKYIISTIIASVIVQPVYSFEILDLLERSHNPTQRIESLLCPNGIFNMDAARKFIFQLQNNVKIKYGVDLDLNYVVEEAMRIMQQTGQFTESEISVAQEFYQQLLKPEIRKCYWGNSKKKKEHKHAKFQNKQFVLPDNMAWGYILMLGGTLMCLIPTGVTQGIGVGMISGGIVVIGQSAIQGEKPYYVDSEL